MSDTQGQVVNRVESDDPIDPGLTVGHVHLRAAGIDRERDFYVRVLGFGVVADRPRLRRLSRVFDPPRTRRSAQAARRAPRPCQ